MSVFQFLVNLVIAIVGCAVVRIAMSYVGLPFEGLIVLVLCIVVVVLTFAQNAAAHLGIS